MILAQKGDLNQTENDDEWYMGKAIGLPKPDNKGEWYLGKRFGLKTFKPYDIIEEGKVVVVEPLVWKNVPQLIADLQHAQHIEGIVAVLELCCTIIDDNMSLALSALNALIRMGTGRLERAVKFGEAGACEYVVTLLHWYGYTEADVCALTVSDDDRAAYNKLVVDCITVCLGAVEVLAAGCKPNREKLGRLGACSYVVEILKRHGSNGRNVHLLELAFNCIWQLSFGNSFNRCLLRESGAENELWRLAHSPFSTPAQCSRAMAVLGWLKSQMAEDVMTSNDPRHVIGGLLLSISEITNTKAKGSPTEALKLAYEGFRAVTRISCMSAAKNSLFMVETFVDGVYAPDVIVKVTRRILRHHKKLFKGDVEYLCHFITASCEALNCMLSEAYRKDKARCLQDSEGGDIGVSVGGEGGEEDCDGTASARSVADQQQQQQLSESTRSTVSGGAVAGATADSEGSATRATERGDKSIKSDRERVISMDSLQSYELVAASSLDKGSDEDPGCLSIESISMRTSIRANKDRWLVQKSADMMFSAGAVKMLVKELDLYIDPHSSHFDRPSKHTHISLQPANIFNIDALSLLSSGTGVITKGVIAGFQGVKMGIAKINDTIQSSLATNVSFPDTPQGNCISMISSSIRLLCDASLTIRVSFLEEELCYTCRRLMSGEFEQGVCALRTWFLEKICDDLYRPCVPHSSAWDASVEDDESMILNMALMILYQFGSNPTRPFLPLDDIAQTIFIEALNHIGKYISVHGSAGESAFEKMEGYERLFMLINKQLISDHQIMDAWLQVITNIALAKLEAKTKLGAMGACEICLDILRVHSLRAHIVQRSLWTLCVMAANHEENIHRISVWKNAASWNADTAQSLLNSVQRSKGQTNEARDHAGLILSWIELRKNMASSRKSRIMRQAKSEGGAGNGADDDDDEDGAASEAPKSKVARRTSLTIPDFSPDDRFFSFMIQGQLKSSAYVDDFGVTEI